MRQSMLCGVVSAEFVARSETEILIGMSNIIPLVLEVLLGAFRPR